MVSSASVKRATAPVGTELAIPALRRAGRARHPLKRPRPDVSAPDAVPQGLERQPLPKLAADYRLELPLAPPAACSSTKPRASSSPAMPSRPAHSEATFE